jgi:N-methylhydantoinase A
MKLDVAAAAEAIERDVATPLGRTVDDAAAAVIDVATENMVQAIESITIEQGIDPTVAVLIGGGGAAGLNASIVGRRLGCDAVIIPQLGGVLSAVGMLLSDLVAEYGATFVASSEEFDLDGVNGVLAGLQKRAQAFIDSAGEGSISSSITFSADARYPEQIWELPVAFTKGRFEGPEDVEALRQAFHEMHEEVFAVHDPGSPIEIVGWRVRAECKLRDRDLTVAREEAAAAGHGAREAWFPETGGVSVPVVEFSALAEEKPMLGPLLVESPLTTVVVEPGTTAARSRLGNLLLSRNGPQPR